MLPVWSFGLRDSVYMWEAGVYLLKVNLMVAVNDNLISVLSVRGLRDSSQLSFLTLKLGDEVKSD